MKSEPRQQESERRTDLVRCLECGTVYRKPHSDQESQPCPTCGYVGWIAVGAGAVGRNVGNKS